MSISYCSNCSSSSSCYCLTAKQCPLVIVVVAVVVVVVVVVVDRDEELESLREAFIIYTQILVSQALEPSFVASLLQDPGTVLVVAVKLSLLQYRGMTAVSSSGGYYTGSSCSADIGLGPERAAFCLMF